MTYNREKLTVDIKRLETEIRKVKARLRTRWVKPMWAEQHALIQLRFKSTLLYCMSATNRYRVHLHDKDHEGQVAHLMCFPSSTQPYVVE